MPQIHIGEAKPGMILDESAVDSLGRVLLEAGEELTDDEKRIAKGLGVSLADYARSKREIAERKERELEETKERIALWPSPESFVVKRKRENEDDTQG